MKKIDLTNYARLGMYQAFKDRAFPCFSTTSLIDVQPLLSHCRQHQLNFFITLSYLISCTVNQIPQFKHRIINDELYEFDVVDPGFTVLLEDENFSFCDAKFFPEFTAYYDDACQVKQAALTQPNHSTHEKHHMFFMTNIPWFSFTSFVHPYDELYGCLPIITLGKYFSQGDSMMLPLAIQVHHGLVDGVHVGKFYQQLARRVAEPQSLLRSPG